MILNAKDLALAKVNRIENGYSAFTESMEVGRLLKRELRKKNIRVIEDRTNLGSWFFPVKEE